MAASKAKIAGMSLDERVEWLEEIWASVEADPAFTQTPEWHREIIAQRLERMKTQPHSGYTLDEIFKRLAARK